MRRRPFAAIALSLAAAGVGPAAAAGQGLEQPEPGPPAEPPEAAPAPGRMSIAVRGGVATRRMRYAARGQRVAVVGRVKPFVAGQVATVELVQQGRVAARYGARITRTRKGGRFVVRFRARRRGMLRVVARHAATPQQAAFRARSRRVRVVRWRAARGASGLRVLLLQRLLRSLGFATPVTGRYDGGTARAVLAYRKTNGMGRSRSASAAVYGELLRRRGRFRLRHPGAGKHVEFDWSRQLLALASRGRAWRVYHVSSGKASTPTVFGSFRFYLKQRGLNAKRMLHSNYFIGGYAIHGFHSVPTYPASHGCIRVPIPNADEIDAWIRLGDLIFLYR